MATVSKPNRIEPSDLPALPLPKPPFLGIISKKGVVTKDDVVQIDTALQKWWEEVQVALERWRKKIVRIVQEIIEGTKGEKGDTGEKGEKGDTGTPGADGSGSEGANPTASVGTTAVNGSAATFLRSDGAPAINQAMTPTWTGLHRFRSSALFTVGSSGADIGAPLISGGSLFSHSPTYNTGALNTFDTQSIVGNSWGGLGSPCLRYMARGIFAANGDNKTVTLLLGAVTIFTITSAINGGHWMLDVEIRKDASTLFWFSRWESSVGGIIMEIGDDGGAINLTVSNNLILKIGGASANDTGAIISQAIWQSR